jgi:hypothetical protein
MGGSIVELGDSFGWSFIHWCAYTVRSLKRREKCQQFLSM